MDDFAALNDAVERSSFVKQEAQEVLRTQNKSDPVSRRTAILSWFDPSLITAFKPAEVGASARC